MSTPFFDRNHDQVLSRLEREELAWLAWGHVDASLSHDEVLAVARAAIADGNGPTTPEDLVDDLVDHHLLIDLGGEPPRYRTRFAEGVRLMARLRQLTPSRSYRQAPELVNDFRVLARPRAFPRREVQTVELLGFLEEDAPLDPDERIALDAMLGARTDPLRLSRFQSDAVRRIRRELSEARTSATIIAAGTGTGKTKAFYLPTLSQIAADGDPEHWARVLAIYPRNELLKDQLAEALAQVDLIAEAGGRTLGVGALFGPTPWTSDQAVRDARGPSHAWREVRGGYACRYLRCPRGCPEDLAWLRSDLESGREVLECPNCSWCSRPGQLALTRRSIKAQPPDVLFTTTEMLNRGLADAEFRSTLIGDSARRPRVLLLDEIHTYGGIHGAHVALLIRRWRQALGPRAPLHIVGLSATLENPSEFITKLTGLTDVQEIVPHEDDLAASGCEYALILRGNPVSGTALLSTTIQATFLLARLLEARALPQRTGTSGSKVFAFTDDLDVTNRLYWNIRSAEGTYANRQEAPLASLRRRTGGADAPAKAADGQIWDICPQLGHPLGPTDRLDIARTSSQDAGVDPEANVIVATSSLELGFDDPDVGGVVQHKAPRDDAAFLQRKGRAGRTESMRPWTLVILSDYGRDRARYQGYETLFAPRLAARSIPTDNLHLLKMQASYALLDWLCVNVPGLRARADLSEPVTGSAAWDRARAERQRKVATLVERVLTDPRRERDLAKHLKYALELTDDQVEAVLWESPRALMTSTLPTMLRRLRANWTTPSDRPDRYIRDVPLPEYAPQALFSDLNLPEVSVVAPARRAGTDPLETAMPVVQALSEFAPGRASRRFGVSSNATWHWVPAPEEIEAGQATIDIDTFVAAYEDVGTLRLADEHVPRRLLRPWRIELELADRHEQQSNARAVWRTQITARSAPWEFKLPADSPGTLFVERFGFHTAALENEVEVGRGVIGSVVTGAEADRDVALVRGVNGNRDAVALGFRGPADALKVVLRRSDLPAFADLADEAQRAVLSAWFERRVITDLDLRAKASQFSLGWLSTLYIAALAGVTAANPQIDDVRGAVGVVADEGLTRCVERALDAVFLAGEVDPDLDDTRALARLRSLIHDADVARRLGEHGASLGDPTASDIDTAWLPQVFATTTAVALREAFQRLCPEADVDGLIIDLEPVVESQQSPSPLEVWLTEPDIGSGGTIEEIRRAASADPGRVARLLAASVAPTDYEVVDWSVRKALVAVRTTPHLAAAFGAVRDARTGAETTSALQRLREALGTIGISPGHAVMSSLNLRVLRPGSSPQTDETLLAALDLWNLVEGQLGLEMDARSVAYAASVQPGATLTLEQVYSLLWPRGRSARGAMTGTYSRFANLPPADPLLLRDLAQEKVQDVPFSTVEGTAAAARTVLARAGTVRLRAASDEASSLRSTLLELIDTQIEVGSVMAYPRAIAGGQTPDGHWVTLELSEAVA
jgi:superfamily II DNA or RNA helicase